MNTTSALKALTGLSQASRLAIFRLLVERGPEGIAAGEIAERVGLPQPTTSFHLKELVNAGLAQARAESRFMYYSANYDAMNGLVSYLTENCCRQGGTCRTDSGAVCAPKVRSLAARKKAPASRGPVKSPSRRTA
jgi:ArsR family transcriptional regulator, arsenate/arsenite/antimonite-responsive transcriptional repressor